VPTNNGAIEAGAPRHGEPRQPTVRRIPGLPLEAELHRTVGGAYPHPRHRVHHHPKPFGTGERIVPVVRLVAVHVPDEIEVARTAERRLDFAGERERLHRRPHR